MASNYRYHIHYVHISSLSLPYIKRTHKISLFNTSLLLVTFLLYKYTTINNNLYLIVVNIYTFNSSNQTKVFFSFILNTDPTKMPPYSSIAQIFFLCYIYI